MRMSAGRWGIPRADAVNAAATMFNHAPPGYVCPFCHVIGRSLVSVAHPSPGPPPATPHAGLPVLGGAAGGGGGPGGTPGGTPGGAHGGAQGGAPGESGTRAVTPPPAAGATL